MHTEGEEVGEETEVITVDSNSPELRLRLEGPAVRHGAVPLPLLAEISKALQTTVRRLALRIEDKPSRHRGRYDEDLALLTELELVGLHEGSAVLEIGLSSPTRRFAQLDLGPQALDALEEGLVALSQGEPVPELWDMGVLEAVNDLLAPVGKGVESLEVQRPSRFLSAVFTASNRETVKARLARPVSAGEEAIEGRLMMIDLGDRERCRVEPALAPSVICTFAPELEDAVRRALARYVRVVGERKTDARGRTQLRLLDIQLIDEPLGGGRTFWESVDLDDLSAQQAVEPLARLEDAIADFWPEGMTVDEFLASIRETA